MKRIPILAVLALLAFPILAEAAPDPAAIAQLAPVPAPTGAIAPAAPVIYLVQPSAPQAPAGVDVEAPPVLEKGSGLSGFINGLGGWGGVIAMVLLFAFAIWKGPRADAAKQAIYKAAEASWFAAEVVGGPGAEKYKSACGAFLAALGQQGVTIDAKAIAIRDQEYQRLSDKDKYERQKLEADIRAKAAKLAMAEPKPSGATANLAEAAR